MNKIDLHIISFDVPFPADYGGVIDVFYRLKALHEQGVSIALHCFEYGRGEQKELEKVASSVFYYSRKKKLQDLFSSIPFIVKSRISEELLKRLTAIDAPILYEGLHSCGSLSHPLLKDRVKWVRAHNVEHDYYSQIAKSSTGLIDKVFHYWEAMKLSTYERVLQDATGVLAISEQDVDYFRRQGYRTEYLPPFHPYIRQESKMSLEKIALYHGNLAVSENSKAVDFLLTVFNSLPYTLVVAGKKPDKRMRRKMAAMENVKLVCNPSENELNQLIKTAKLNCLPTFQSTGVKLKLIHALISGNEVLVNRKMLEGSGLSSFVNQAESIEDWRMKVKELMENPLQEKTISERQKAVEKKVSNQLFSQKMMEWFAPAR